MRNSTRLAAIALFCVIAGGNLWGGALLEPTDAPEWKVSQWLNSDPGTLKSLRGKVVLIEFFQLWCPGCNRFSLPLFEAWQEKYSDRDDVVLVSIHTVFEGHDVQTPEHLAMFVEQRGITRPVGIDEYGPADDEVPLTMNRYGTGGTPHVVIVDRAGQIRFSHFASFEVEPVEAFIQRLLDEKAVKNNKSAPAKTGRGRKAAGRQPSPTPKAAPKPKAAAAPAKKPADGDLDRTLSGTYQVTVEQSDKSCADPDKPQQLIAELMVYPDRIDVRSVRPLLGLRKFSVSYNDSSGSFEADLFEEVQQKNVPVSLKLKLTGTLDPSTEPPSFEYEFTFEKQGENRDWDCFIEGRGAGTLAKSRGP